MAENEQFHPKDEASKSLPAVLDYASPRRGKVKRPPRFFRCKFLLAMFGFFLAGSLYFYARAIQYAWTLGVTSNHHAQHRLTAGTNMLVIAAAWGVMALPFLRPAAKAHATRGLWLFAGACLGFAITMSLERLG